MPAVMEQVNRMSAEEAALEVVLPNTLRCIREGAFVGCMVEKLVIPEGCVLIGEKTTTCGTKGRP